MLFTNKLTSLQVYKFTGSQINKLPQLYLFTSSQGLVELASARRKEEAKTSKKATTQLDQDFFRRKPNFSVFSDFGLSDRNRVKKTPLNVDLK